MTRHRFHGDWNYTLHPRGEQSPPSAHHSDDERNSGPGPDRALLSHPELTGMPRHRLDEIAAQLAESQARQREQTRQARRGAERRRAAGAGPPIKLTGPDRVLATVLYLRRLCTQAVLAELFNVDRKTITTAVQETRPLLEQHGYAITPSTARFPTPADLAAFLDGRKTAPRSEIKSAC